MKTHQKTYPQMEQNELKDSLKMILKSSFVLFIKEEATYGKYREVRLWMHCKCCASCS